jgi:diacylglycerol kinase (ATP)
MDALAASGLDVEVRVSVDAADLLRIADAAYARDRGVIACGGDGTVAALAGVAAEAGGVLGIVPIGSGNDFARHLAIPRNDARAAIDVLSHGRVDRVDLGRARTADGTSCWFTTVANTGFDAEANRWANDVTWTSGTPLYVLAALRTLARSRPRRFAVTVDDDTFELDAWLVAVGNTRSYASGMMITPAADVHDGRLDVCVVGPVGRTDFLRTFPTVFRGTHVRHPMVSSWQATRVTLESRDGASLPELWASGERVGSLPASLEPAPRALAVMVPRARSVTD